MFDKLSSLKGFGNGGVGKFTSRGLKSRNGQKWVKVSRVYGSSRSTSRDNLVHDLGTVNMNRITLKEAKEIVGDSKRLDLKFNESVTKVIEEVCHLIRGN